MEPVLENIGIVLPDEGYLAKVRALCDDKGVLLIFDEVKTGLTAGPQGASNDWESHLTWWHWRRASVAGCPSRRSGVGPR